MKSFLIEYIHYLKQRKKIFLIPVMAVLILIGGLLAVTQGSAIAPFIYTLF